MSVVSRFLDIVTLSRPPGKVSKRVVQFEPGPGATYEGPSQRAVVTKKKMPGPKSFSLTVPIRTVQEGTPAFQEEARVRKLKPTQVRPTRIVIADQGEEVSPKFPEYYYNEGIRPSRRGITVQQWFSDAPQLFRP